MTSARLCVAMWLLAALVAFGCASKTNSAAPPAPSARDPRVMPYVIGPADLVRVTVWKDPSLSAETSVRPDGKMTVPLVGEVEAANHTADEIKQEIERRLVAFVKDAIVTVTVVEVNSYRFTVAGNVERPGMFTPRYYITVSEAIALAGGPNRYATLSELIVIRPRPGKVPLRIPVNYEQILSGQRPDQNIVMFAGDTLLVP